MTTEGHDLFRVDGPAPYRLPLLRYMNDDARARLGDLLQPLDDPDALPFGQSDDFVIQQAEDTMSRLRNVQWNLEFRIRDEGAIEDPGDSTEEPE
jgi:hypothetical protein